MAQLRYFSSLVLALSLTGRPSQAQKTDLAPMLPVQPQLLPPVTPGTGPVRRPAPAGQPPIAAAVGMPRPSAPLVLLNSRVITGLGGLADINPNDIERIAVYKAAYPGSTTPAEWRSLSTNGIIDLTLKKKVRLKSQSLAQLGRHLQAKGRVSYLLNGLPATSSHWRIATEGIEEIKLTHTAASTTVSVWFLQVSGKPSPPHPPGTIMIRGVASR